MPEAKFSITAEDKTQKAFRSVKKSLGDLTHHFTELKMLVLEIAGITGFGALIESSIESAAEIKKLSERLGSSTEALSQYRHVAEMSHVPFEALVKSWQQMEKNISAAANNMGMAREALAELHLSAKQLNTLNPEQQFEILADALGKIPNHADKVRLAFEIMGRSGVQMLQMMEGGTEKIQSLREEADRLGLTLHEDAANSMLEAAEAMKNIKEAARGLGNTLAIEFAPSITLLARGFENLIEWGNHWKIAMLAIADAVLKGWEHIKYGSQVACAVMGAIWDTTIQKMKNAFANFLQSVAKGLAKMPGFAHAASELTHYAETLKLSTSNFQKRLDELSAAHHAAVKAIDAHTLSLVAYQLDMGKAKEATVSHKKALTEYHTALNQSSRTFTEYQQKQNMLLAQGKHLTEEMRTPQEIYANHLKQINQLLQAGAITQETYNRALKKYQQDLNDASGATQAFQEQQRAAEENVRKITDIFRNGFFAFMQDGFKGMVKSFENSLQAMAADAAASELSKLVFGKIAESALKDDGGLLNQLLNNGSGTLFNFGGFKAKGGAVTAGKSYIVGEQGAELFVPRQNGMIVPHQKTSSSQSIIINNYIQTPNADSFRRAESNLTARMKMQLDIAARRNL